jgi:hypothetical protein
MRHRRGIGYASAGALPALVLGCSSARSYSLVFGGGVVCGLVVYMVYFVLLQGGPGFTIIQACERAAIKKKKKEEKKGSHRCRFRKSYVPAAKEGK